MLKCKGTTLVEILMSLLLLSLIMLGWEVMQTSALRTMKSAHYFSTAHQQLLTLAESIKANNGIFTKDFSAWQRQNKEVLPQGLGKISGQYPFFILSIRWGGKILSEGSNTEVGHARCLQLPLHL